MTPIPTPADLERNLEADLALALRVLVVPPRFRGSPLLADIWARDRVEYADDAAKGWPAAIRLAIAYRDECARLRSQVERHAERASRHRSAEPAFEGIDSLTEERRITVLAGLNLLREGDRVPVCFPGVRPAVVWLRHHVVEAMQAHGVSLSGAEMTRQGFGLVIDDGRGLIYVASRNSTVLPGMEDET